VVLGVEATEGAADGGFVDGGAVAVGGEEIVADFREEEGCHFGGGTRSWIMVVEPGGGYGVGVLIVLEVV
jgi:hypothetical protein